MIEHKMKRMYYIDCQCFFFIRSSFLISTSCVEYAIQEKYKSLMMIIKFNETSNDIDVIY